MIKRYDPDLAFGGESFESSPTMSENEMGDYVKYTDYLKLLEAAIPVIEQYQLCVPETIKLEDVITELNT